MRGAPILLAIAIIAAGCGGRDRELRLKRLAVEGRTLQESLDRLEDRLLVDQARVRFWREMQARHESVTAIACNSLERHAEGMARFDAQQKDKGESLARRSRLASRFIPRTN